MNNWNFPNHPHCQLQPHPPARKRSESNVIDVFSSDITSLHTKYKMEICCKEKKLNQLVESVMSQLRMPVETFLLLAKIRFLLVRNNCKTKTLNPSMIQAVLIFSFIYVDFNLFYKACAYLFK